MDYLKEVLDHWQLKGSVSPITGGNVNSNWQLDTGENEYIIRQVASWKNREDILFEHQYLREIQRSNLGYVVPSPLIAKDGSSFLQIKDGANTNLIWIYPKISGNSISSKKLTECNIIQIAKFLGVYHSWLVNSKISPRSFRTDSLNRDALQEELDGYIQIISQNSKTPADITNIISQVKTALNLLSDYHAPDGEQYPIHRDLRPSNILWDDENRITGILDFEKVSDTGDILLKDVSVSLLSLGIASHKSLSDAFLGEYQMWYPLPPHHSQSLPLIHLSSIIEDVLYAIWLWSHQGRGIDVSTLSHCVRLYSAPFL